MVRRQRATVVLLIACSLLFACEQQEVPQPPPPAEPPAILPGQLPGQIPPGKLPPGLQPGQIPPGKIPPGMLKQGQLPAGQLPPGTNPALAAALSSPQFGLTKQEAINVCQPNGEHLYLAALRCPGGATPQTNRLGSVGARNPGPGNNPAMLDANTVLPPGTVDEHIIDEYEVTCGGAKTKIYFDMYHCRDPHPLRPVGLLQPLAGAVPPTQPGAGAVPPTQPGAGAVPTAQPGAGAAPTAQPGAAAAPTTPPAQYARPMPTNPY